MKKLLAVVLSLMMLLGLVPFGIFEAKTAEAAENWVLVEDHTTLATTDVVTLVATYDDTQYLMSNDNGTGDAPAAVVWDGPTVPDNCKWNISLEDRKYIFYPNGTTATWLYCTGTNNGVRVGTNTNKTFTLDTTSGYFKHDGTSRYLGVYRTNPDWRCYTNTTGNTANQTFAIYKLSTAEATATPVVTEKPTETPTPEPTATPVVTAPPSTGGTTYTKVTTAPSDWSGQYLIVYEDESRIFDGSRETFDAVNNYQSVDISNSQITTDSSFSFTIAKSGSGYSIRSASGMYIGQTVNDNGLKASGDTVYENTLSLNDDKTVNIVSGGAYLRFNTTNGQDRFRYFKSTTYTGQKAICLYKATTGTEPTPEPDAFDPNVENADVYVYAPHVASDDILVTIGDKQYMKYDILISDYSALLQENLDGVSGLTAYLAWDMASLPIVYTSETLDEPTAYYYKNTVAGEDIVYTGPAVSNMSMQEGLTERGGEIASSRGFTNAISLSYYSELPSDTIDYGGLRFENGIVYSLYFEVPNVPDGTVFYVDFVDVRLDGENTYFSESATIELLDYDTQEVISATYAAYDGTITIGAEATEPAGCYVNGHTYGAYTVTTPATCTAAGEQTATCTVCGHADHQAVPATGHDYTYTSNGDGTHDAVCNNDSSHTILGEACDTNGTGGACSCCGYKESSGDPDYSGTYYIATIRTSGNYFYMTNDLGTASTKRYQAVDSGLTELPSIIEDAEVDKTFTLTKNADGTYLLSTVVDDVTMYLYHSGTSNSGSLTDSADTATKITVEQLAEGTFNLHYTASDAERYLSLNDTSNNNYFAWYTGTQKQDLVLIPVKTCDHANTEERAEVPATCTEDGLTAGTYCTECGTYVTGGETIPATGHSYDDGVVTTEPTCTQEGVMTYTCTACGDTYTEPIPANGHTYGDDDICDVCGATKPNISVVLINNGSVYTTITGETTVTLPTVSSDCSAFDFVGWMEYDENFEPTATAPTLYTDTYTLTGDTATLVAVYSTTANLGTNTTSNMTFTTANSGNNETHGYGSIEAAEAAASSMMVLIEKTGTYTDENGIEQTYTYWAIATAADIPVIDSAEAAGVGTKMILAALYNGVYYAIDNTSDDNNKALPGVPITDLSAINDTDFANCIYTAQYGTHNCSSGGPETGLVLKNSSGKYLHLNTTNVNTDQSTLHAFIEFVDSGDGLFRIRAYLCDAKTYSYIRFAETSTTTTMYVTDANHNYVADILHASCTEEGETTYTCSYCGDTYTDVVPALGHDWIIQTTSATCTEPGRTVKTCSRCGLVETTEGEALGHDLGAAVHTDGTANAASTHTHYCSRCDYSETEPCSFTASISTANYMVTGFTKYTCSECSYSYTVTGETYVPYTLGAAARLDYKKIRFGGQLDVAILQATYDAGDTFTYGFDIACVYGDQNGAETFVQVGTVTWTDAMDKAATGQALTELLRAAGCKVYGYTNTTITFSAILYDSKDLTDDTGMPRIASAEFRFEAKILKGTATSTGRCLKNSIINIIDNNGASVETTM